jgi:hypothetical protein
LRKIYDDLLVWITVFILEKRKNAPPGTWAISAGSIYIEANLSATRSVWGMIQYMVDLLL